MFVSVHSLLKKVYLTFMFQWHWKGLLYIIRMFSALFLKTIFLVKLLSFNILLTQKEILMANHLSSLLQALLTAVISMGGFQEGEEI